MAENKRVEASSPCACSQAAADIIKAVSPIKDSMLKEVKCKGCGKTFLANFETEYCFDCRKSLKGEKQMAKTCGAWYPTIFPEKCDGCVKIGKPRCVEFCPQGVFAFNDGKAIVANLHKCVDGCTACEPLCHNKVRQNVLDK